MKHDTKGLIERTAKVFAKSYETGGNAEWLDNFKGKVRKRELMAMQLWFIKEYGWHIFRAFNDADRVWFTQQRPNYQSTLRWQIFIHAVKFITQGR